MRGLTLLLAATLTVSYSYVATAAIVADRSAALSRAEVEPGSTELPVWDGGTLAPVTVEAPAPVGIEPQRCASPAAPGAPLAETGALRRA
jgi:hypothetical protein